MRVSRAQAEENRRRIVEVAGELFREHGFDGIGIADLMKAAGLTHGGFYGQFESKEDLVVEACDRVFAESVEQWSTIVGRAEDNPLAELVGSYLSDRHRDEMGSGCMLAALATDAARRGEAVRSSFTEGIRGYLAILSSIVPGRTEAERRANAIAALSEMIGALVLARSIDDKDLSREILEAAAADLTTPSGG